MVVRIYQHCYNHAILPLCFCLNCFNPFMTVFPINRNRSINLLCKSMDWFLYDRDLLLETILTTSISRRIFRTLSNIYDEKVFLQKNFFIKKDSLLILWNFSKQLLFLRNTCEWLLLLGQSLNDSTTTEDYCLLWKRVYCHEKTEWWWWTFF